MSGPWEDYGIAPQASRYPNPGPTPSQTVGPFFEIGMAWMGPEGEQLVDPGSAGSLTLSGQVFDGSGAPIPDAVVEIWQADAAGAIGAHHGFRGFGRSLASDDGAYRFTTVAPGAPEGVAPYIAMSIFARGTLQRLTTRVYLPDHPANAADPLLASLDEAARATLVATRAGDDLRHDVHLQGDAETVFLEG